MSEGRGKKMGDVTLFKFGIHLPQSSLLGTPAVNMTMDVPNSFAPPPN